MFLSPVKAELEERTPQHVIPIQVISLSPHWQFWLASLFLVSVPVFFEAPLVRHAPWLSLICTVGWLAIAKHLQESPKSKLWGSLIWGFSLTWLCGSLY